MKPRIVVVGSLNMDVVCEVARAPADGETVHGERVSFLPGGKGANQAVAAARMGAGVAMIGSVGEDAFGSQLQQGLADEGIDVTHVDRVAGTSSGIAIILVDAHAQNRITVVPGANAALTPDRVASAADVLHGAAMLLVQLETPLPTVEQAMREARGAGVPVMLNPAPAAAVPDAWWPLIDCLVPNETEAGHLTGMRVVDDRTALAAARTLQSRGVKRVIVTLGARGALICEAGESTIVAAPSVTAVDTTAAGDTFIGALAVMLAEGQALDTAAAWANRAASLSVTRRGAQASIPWRAEL